MTDPRIEAAARALCERQGYSSIGTELAEYGGFKEDWEVFADDAKAALEAAGAAAWRPIESAPKGKKILVREGGDWIGIAIFHTEGKFSGRWIYINAVDSHENLFPTHWQPLPTPPAS